MNYRQRCKQACAGKLFVLSVVRLVLVCVWISPISVLAGKLKGSLESGVQMEKQINTAYENSLIQLGFLNYQPDVESLQFTLDYMMKVSFPEDSKINQAYGQYKVADENSSAKLGRFHRADVLGFYTLDGVQFEHLHRFDKDSFEQDIQLEYYVGKPTRTDDEHTLYADYLFGVEARYSSLLGAEASHKKIQASSQTAQWFKAYSPSVDYRLGFQQFKQATVAKRLNVGVNYNNTADLLNAHLQEINLSSSYLLGQNSLEDFLFNARFYSQTQNYIQFTYELYQPESDNPSFREQFYSSFALGEQQLAELALHRKEPSGLKWVISGRKTVGEHRQVSGYGFRSSLKFQPRPYAEISAELDILTLGDDQVKSVWLGGSHSPDYKTQVKLDTGLQFEDKSLYGFNRAVGIRGSYQYMFNRDFFVSASAEHIWNNQKENAYRVNSAVTYYFLGD